MHHTHSAQSLLAVLRRGNTSAQLDCTGDGRLYLLLMGCVYHSAQKTTPEKNGHVPMQIEASIIAFTAEAKLLSFHSILFAHISSAHSTKPIAC